jgi:aminoglycoside 3-N-acetyltransferase I
MLSADGTAAAAGCAIVPRMPPASSTPRSRRTGRPAARGARAALQLLQLDARHLARARELLQVFGDAFEDPDTYDAIRPDAAYLRRLLGSRSFIALAALHGGRVVGGLVAYELPKLEQARSEIYLYDLAVLAAHRRRGVATTLIRRLQALAAARGAWVIFVQADTGAEDQPAIALYERLGQREAVLHFDIPVRATPKGRS